MFALVDSDNDGYVSFREFLDMIVIFAKGICQEYIIYHDFIQEYFQVFRYFPKYFNMFALVDSDNDGYVSFREFLDMIVIFAKGIFQEYFTLCDIFISRL